ncbi:MAG: hypothetical protein EOO75_02480 [Myxococcales bacterium]|nr:MAG: hypothetical protein EOO75_02480 [Myxococcales bacterium]
MRWTTYAREAHTLLQPRREPDLARPPSMYTPVHAPRLSRAPVEPTGTRLLAVSLTALGAGALAAGGHGGAPVRMVALVSTGMMAALLALPSRRSGLFTRPAGTLAISKTRLHLLTDAANRSSPLARLVWRRSRLRAGRIERTLDPRASWTLVLDHVRGHELRLIVHSLAEAESILAALGLDPASRAASFPLASPPSARTPSYGLARCHLVASLVLSLVVMNGELVLHRPVLAPALVWAACALQALLALFYRMGESAAPSPALPQLRVGADGLVTRAGFVSWTGLTRLRRSRHGLRLTRPGQAPVAIDLQTYPAPALPERRAVATTPVEALRDSIAGAIDRYRKRPALAMPAIEDAASAGDYRQPARSLSADWSTLCDGDARPAERVAAAGAIAAVAPRLLRVARPHLVEPTTVAALDRLLSGTSIQKR